MFPSLNLDLNNTNHNTFQRKLQQKRVWVERADRVHERSVAGDVKLAAPVKRTSTDERHTRRQLRERERRATSKRVIANGRQVGRQRLQRQRSATTKRKIANFRQIRR